MQLAQFFEQVKASEDSGKLVFWKNRIIAGNPGIITGSGFYVASYSFMVFGQFRGAPLWHFTVSGGKSVDFLRRKFLMDFYLCAESQTPLASFLSLIVASRVKYLHVGYAGVKIPLAPDNIVSFGLCLAPLHLLDKKPFVFVLSTGKIPQEFSEFLENLEPVSIFGFPVSVFPVASAPVGNNFLLWRCFDLPVLKLEKSTPILSDIPGGSAVALMDALAGWLAQAKEPFSDIEPRPFGFRDFDELRSCLRLLSEG